ncbi:MAG: hypothetical protein ACOY5F_22115 [Pseudomonadota bacterium]|jgi:hypothetical protein
MKDLPMPPFLEEAAQLLWFLCRAGLRLDVQLNPRPILFKLAAHLYVFPNRKLSHAAAAAAILDDLLSSPHITCEARQRARLIAVIGTYIGNLFRRMNHAA